jgi:hypothetical protein
VLTTGTPICSQDAPQMPKKVRQLKLPAGDKQKMPPGNLNTPLKSGDKPPLTKLPALRKLKKKK